jgi:hypothetical protein
MHSSIADFISDIIENSIESGASSVIVDIIEENRVLRVYIADNGSGMDEDTLSKIKDPFYTGGAKHQHRKVGLGIPFIIQAVEAVNGEFDIKSEKGYGTSVYFSFDLSHIDSPPLGDIIKTTLFSMAFDGNYELVVNRHKNGKKYSVLRSDLLSALGEIQSADSLILAKNFISSLEEELN